jgi:hypothetical protein
MRDSKNMTIPPTRLTSQVSCCNTCINSMTVSFPSGITLTRVKEQSRFHSHRCRLESTAVWQSILDVSYERVQASKELIHHADSSMVYDKMTK